jgi:hypothetical protein
MKRKNKIAPFVANFCKEISSENPVIIPLRPIVGKPQNECFNIVPEYISANGGKQKIGWYILCWRHVLIEAAFHCVWESPEGELIDITPKIYKMQNIVFLPDPTKNYTGRQVDNIRKPLAPDKNILKFISLAEEYIRYVNNGDLADYYGKVEIKEDFIHKYNFMKQLESHLVAKYGNSRSIAQGR